MPDALMLVSLVLYLHNGDGKSGCPHRYLAAFSRLCHRAIGVPERVHQGWGWPSRNPVLLHEGWQDRFPDQMIGQYERLRRRGVDVALTIGPWTHVGVGTKGAGIVMTETLDWLAEHLAGTGRRQRLNDTQPRSDAGPTTFTYDPADPTPAVGGQIINPAAGGYRDNQKLEERADVLTFTSPSLSEPLEVIGNPAVEVVHQTDNPHADLFVRVCEVRKNGRSINLSDGFQRLDPAKSSGTISIRLEAMAHRFTPGVRIRLQISGGAHPRYARNLGTNQDPATSSTWHHPGGRSSMVPAASPASPCRARSSSAGLIDLVRTREIPSESTVLYAHLGGQPALKRIPLAVALTTEPGIPRSVHLAFLVGARIAAVGRTLIASVTGLADAFR